MRRTFRIRTHNTLAVRFIVVTALIFAAFIPLRLVEVSELRRRSADESAATVARIANNGVQHVQDVIDEARLTLSIAALLPMVADSARPDCHVLFTQIVVDRPSVLALAAVGRDGTVLCSSNSAAEGVNVADRPYFREALARQRFVLSPVVRSRATNRPVLLAAAPVAGRGETAALILTIDTSFLTTVASEISDEDMASLVMVLDEKGQIVAQNARAKEDGAVPSDFVATLFRHDDDATWPVTLTDGRTLLAARRLIPHTQASFVIGVPVERLQRVALAVETNLVEDAALVLAVIVLVFWFGQVNFVEPLRILSKAAEEVARGRFDARFNTDGWPDEYRSLARALRGAGRALQGRHENDEADKARLHALSERDPLTDLLNRRALDVHSQERWTVWRESGQEFAVIAFDVDHFKLFNDRYGHDAGDAALIAVGEAMRAEAERIGGVAARTGGEEFLIVAPGSGEAAIGTAETVLARVRALRMPHERSSFGIVTLSAGVASCASGEPADRSDVFRMADRALYRAKNTGRNRVTTAGAAAADAVNDEGRRDGAAA